MPQFSKKEKDFGVLTIDKRVVRVYEAKTQYTNINAGEDVNDARWSGSSVTVYLKSGKVRQYDSITTYTNI